jgi:branched-chain amino acid transport system substrate-binding protein
MLKKAIILLLVLFPIHVFCNEKTFHIAGIFAKSSKFPASLELECMTRAVLDNEIKKGLPVSYEIFDNKRDFKLNLRISKEIATSGKFDAVIGTLYSSEGIATSDILAKHNLPFFVPTATNPALTKNKPNVVPILYNDVFQASALAKYTQETIKPRSITVLINISKKYSTFLAAEYIRNIEKSSNAQIHTIEYHDNYKDFKKLARTIVEHNSDLIFLPIYGLHSVLLYVELSKHDREFFTLGGDAIGGRKGWFDIVRNTTPKIKFHFVKNWSRSFFNNDLTKQYFRIYEAYCNQYAHSFMTTVAFDSTTLLIQSIKDSLSTKATNLASVAKDIKLDGALGKLYFNEFGTAVRKLNIFSIENNELKYIGSYD